MTKKNRNMKGKKRLGFKLPEILTYSEIERFLLSIETPEDLLAIRVMLYSGLRVGEVCQLMVEDIDPVEMMVHVRKGKGDKERYAPLDVHTISFLKSYVNDHNLSPDSRLVSLSERSVERHVKAIANMAGITRFEVTPHTLRHTCATWQLDKGIPLPAVQANLGHSDITTTQIYLHLDIRKRVRSYREATWL